QARDEREGRRSLRGFRAALPELVLDGSAKTDVRLEEPVDAINRDEQLPEGLARVDALPVVPVAAHRRDAPPRPTKPDSARGAPPCPMKPDEARDGAHAEQRWLEHEQDLIDRRSGGAPRARDGGERVDAEAHDEDGDADPRQDRPLSNRRAHRAAAYLLLGRR